MVEPDDSWKKEILDLVVEVNFVSVKFFYMYFLSIKYLCYCMYSSVKFIQ